MCIYEIHNIAGVLICLFISFIAKLNQMEIHPSFWAFLIVTVSLHVQGMVPTQLLINLFIITKDSFSIKTERNRLWDFRVVFRIRLTSIMFEMTWIFLRSKYSKSCTYHWRSQLPSFSSCSIQLLWAGVYTLGEDLLSHWDRSTTDLSRNSWPWRGRSQLSVHATSSWILYISCWSTAWVTHFYGCV